MLVRIVKDWNYPETFFGQTPEGNGLWDNVQFTEDPVPECDYLLVLQRPPYTIKVKCPKGNAWLITQEPPTDYFKFFIKSFKYFDRVYSYYREVRHPHVQSMQPVLPWHLLKTYKYLRAISSEDLSNKKNEVVWITSNKKGFPGQKARMLLREYFEQSNMRIHLFGRGFTPIKDKFDGLFPHKYALAIENFSTDDYWTEKIADSFLSWCLPFYWGAGNLEKFFPPESFIRIDITKPAEALTIIQNAIRTDQWSKRLNAIEQARDLILDKYQFFPYMAQIIKEDSKMISNKPPKNYIIPENTYPWRYKVINQIKYYWSRLFQS